MDAFADKAREIVDDITAMVKDGVVRERIVEKLAVSMRSANAQWCRDQAAAPAKHDPFPQLSDGATDAA